MKSTFLKICEGLAATPLASAEHSGSSSRIESTQSDDCLRPGANSYEFIEEFSITDPNAGCRQSVSISLGLVPLLFKRLVQWDDLKLCSDQSVINRLVDLRVGTAQVEPADSDLFGQRFGGDGGSVSCGKPILQKIHPLNDMIHVFGHRADGIQMFWLNRKNALQRNKAKRRLQTHDAATSCGNADGARRIRSKGNVCLSLATATADPLDEPPGISLLLLFNGLLGVPKKSLMPEGATANSLRFVFPTICTFLAVLSPGTRHHLSPAGWSRQRNRSQPWSPHLSYR